MTPVPYDPENCMDEFGWIWADTDGSGETWNLVSTYRVGGAVEVAFHAVACDPGDYFCDEASTYRRLPYVPLKAPDVVPLNGVARG